MAGKLWFTCKGFDSHCVEGLREDIAAGAVGHDSALDVGNFCQAGRDRPIDREALEWHIEEMNLVTSSALHLGDIEVDDLRFESEESLLNQLSGPEKLLTALRRLTGCFVLGPVFGLTILAAVKSRALSAGEIGVRTAGATSGRRLTAGLADATWCGLRGHV